MAYRKRFDRKINLNAEIEVTRPDITERDNSLLSLAAARIYPLLADMFDRELIDSDELMRLMYRMAGETFDEKKPAPPGKRKPIETNLNCPCQKRRGGGGGYQ